MDALTIHLTNEHAAWGYRIMFRDKCVSTGSGWAHAFDAAMAACDLMKTAKHDSYVYEALADFVEQGQSA